MRSVSLAVAAGGLLLAGCSLVPYGPQATSIVESAIETGIKDRVQYNDRKAELLPVLTCDISVGAYSRMVESNVKRGVALICGLDDGTAAAADIRAAQEIVKALTGLPPAGLQPAPAPPP